MENPPFKGCISYWTRGFAIAMLVFGGYFLAKTLPVFLKFRQRWAWIWKMVTRIDSEWWTASHRIPLRTSISGRNGTTYVSIWIYPKISTKHQNFHQWHLLNSGTPELLGPFFSYAKNSKLFVKFPGWRASSDLHQTLMDHWSSEVPWPAKVGGWVSSTF